MREMQPGRRRRRAHAAAVLAVAVLLGACSGDEADDDEVAAAERTSSTIEVSVPPGSAEDGYAGARSDVTDLACESDDGRWQATGQVSNPTDAEVDYRIYVSFLDPEDESRGLVQTDVEGVPGGEAEEWAAELDLSEEDLRCVLRVERAAVDGDGSPEADDEAGGSPEGAADDEDGAASDEETDG
jgi:hypothetical protein